MGRRTRFCLNFLGLGLWMLAGHLHHQGVDHLVTFLVWLIGLYLVLIPDGIEGFK